MTRPMLGFKSFEAAQLILVGIELMHILRKGRWKMRAHKASVWPNSSTLSPHNHPTDRGDSPQIGHTQKLAPESFLLLSTGRSARWRAKPITSSASTTRRDSAFHACGTSSLPPCTFSRDSNICASMAQKARHLRYSPLMNACAGARMPQSACLPHRDSRWPLAPAPSLGQPHSG